MGVLYIFYGVLMGSIVVVLMVVLVVYEVVDGNYCEFMNIIMVEFGDVLGLFVFVWYQFIDFSFGSLEWKYLNFFFGQLEVNILSLIFDDYCFV